MSAPPRLPSFLLIGAQKCGTTTLYEDLRSHPGLWLPDKETSGLLNARLPDPSAVAEYESLFSSSGNLMTGEVSTRYAMLPSFEVAGIAREVLGSARILYIVREPVARVISHHHHDYALGIAPYDIDLAIRQNPELVDHSRYATQAEAWVAKFGSENLRMVRFEDYIGDRQSTANSIFDFLGVEEWTLPAPDLVHNSAEEKVIAIGAWQRLSQSGFYRRAVRPLLPEPARRRMLGALLPKAPPRPPGPSYETVSRLVHIFQDEVVRLGEITGEGPWWDLDEVLSQRRTTGFGSGA